MEATVYVAMTTLSLISLSASRVLPEDAKCQNSKSPAVIKNYTWFM